MASGPVDYGNSDAFNITPPRTPARSTSTRMRTGISQIERTQRMHGQSIAAFNEQCIAHRKKTKDLGDEFVAYKNDAERLFHNIDDYVKIKVGESENATNIGVNEQLHVFADKLKYVEASLNTLTSFVDKVGQNEYNIATEQRVNPMSQPGAEPWQREVRDGHQ